MSTCLILDALLFWRILLHYLCSDFFFPSRRGLFLENSIDAWLAGFFLSLHGNSMGVQHIELDNTTRETFVRFCKR